jgi:mannose-6-phosphate isomerase
MQEFLRFAPLPQERVWGGRALESALGRDLPPGDRPFGESWEIVDRPEAQSVVVGGQFAGLTLRELMERHSAEIMGPRWPAGKAFPLLVKWLDCRERLSLQVHPPATVAKELGGEPKTENWFIAAAAPQAHLIVGLKPGVTRAQFEAAVAAGTAEACVNRFPVAAGDSVFVRSGTVHAIDGGNLILEIQQNSDTTYRVFDWGRVGLDGKPRQLHLAESLQSILWDAAPPRVVKGERKTAMLADAPEFQIRRVPLVAGETLRFAAGEQPRILSVVEGRLSSASGELLQGENAVVPIENEFIPKAVVNSSVLVTENFG